MYTAKNQTEKKETPNIVAINKTILQPLSMNHIHWNVKQKLGCCIDPSLSKRNNIHKYMPNTTTEQFMTNSKNITFYDYTITATLSLGTANLLGLNLKFFIQEPTPKKQFKKWKRTFTNSL